MPRTRGPRWAIIVLVAALVVALVVSPTRAQPDPQAIAAATPQTTVLANGLTIVSRQRPSAEVVSVAVSVRVGGRDEPRALRGGTHWLEHSSFLGTERYPSESEVFRAIADLGGDINARTDAEATTYFATVPAADLDAAVTVLAEMVLRPTFPLAAMERERAIVQEELRGQRVSTVGLAMRTLGEALLGPAANDAGSTVESVGRIDRAALLTYRERYYVARNMVVSVVGPGTHAQVAASVARAFTDAPAGERPTAVALTPPVQSARLTSETPFASVVAVGTRIPGLDSADAAALLVFDAILDGPGTRMVDALVEAKVARSGGTRIQQLSDVGLWAGFALAPPSRADAVAEVVRAQVRRMQDERVSADELRAATRYLAGRTLLGGETVTEQSVRLAELTALGSYTTEEADAGRILAVTADDVQRVARTYFDPDSFSILAQR